MSRFIILLLAVATVAAFVAGFPAPQGVIPQPGPGQYPSPPSFPNAPSLDPALIQDCKKQKEACETQYASLNNGTQSGPPEFGKYIASIQNGANQVNFCEQQYNACLQASNYNKPPAIPGQGGNPPTAAA